MISFREFLKENVQQAGAKNSEVIKKHLTGKDAAGAFTLIAQALRGETQIFRGGGDRRENAYMVVKVIKDELPQLANKMLKTQEEWIIDEVGISPRSYQMVIKILEGKMNSM